MACAIIAFILVQIVTIVKDSRHVWKAHADDSLFVLLSRLSIAGRLVGKAGDNHG